MVTEIWGILNQNDSQQLAAKMAAKAIYKVNHQWHEKKVDYGYMGVILIGDRIKNQSKTSFFQRGKLTVCADISVYNRKELLEELELQSSVSDTELLLYAFEKWHYNCVHHLLGDFAFAIWDASAKELFCARDPIGIRPFYYTSNKGGFIFASELRMVSAIYEHQPGLNDDYLLDTLVTMISEKPDTPFENIYRLPPAHTLIFRNGNTVLDNYRELNLYDKLRYSDENKYVEQFRETLIHAVQIRCNGLLNIASELSGGLDSSLVTCVSSEYAQSNQILFSAYSNTLPDGHQTIMKDEKEFISKVLAWKNMDWHEINELKDTLPELIRHTIETQGCFTQQRFHMFNKGIYEAAGYHKAEILLSGFGGDEMVSARTGNAAYDLIREKQWNVLYQALKFRTSIPVAILKVLRSIISYRLKKNRNREVTSGFFTPDMLNRRLQNLPLQDSFLSYNQLKRRYFSKHERQAKLFLAEKQLQKICHQHVSQRLEYSYAAAAQYGIQYRYPLLDARLLQLTLSYPAWIKNKPGTDRYLFRQAILGLVPEEIRLRSDKSGAVIPQMYIRLQKDRELLNDYFQIWSSNDDLRKIFDFSRFESWMEALLERNPDEMNYLMPGAFYNYLMIMFWFTEHNNR